MSKLGFICQSWDLYVTIWDLYVCGNTFVSSKKHENEGDLVLRHITTIDPRSLEKVGIYMSPFGIYMFCLYI
jgi:hypothetical protein